MALFGESAKTERKRNLQANKELAEFTSNVETANSWFNWQRTFNATNEYNDPSAQLQRLYDAGINPLSFNDFENISSAGSAGGGSASTGINTHQTDPAQVAMGLLQQGANFINVGSNTSKNMADIKKVEAETANISATTPYVSDMNEAQIKKLLADTNKSLKDSNLTDEQISQIKANIDMMYKDLEIKNKDLLLRMREVQTKEKQANTDYQRNQWQEEVAKGQLANDWANTRISNDRLSFDKNEKFDFEKSKFTQSYELDVKKLNSSISDKNWDRVNQIIDDMSVHFLGNRVKFFGNFPSMYQMYIDSYNQIMNDPNAPLQTKVLSTERVQEVTNYVSRTYDAWQNLLNNNQK